MVQEPKRTFLVEKLLLGVACRFIHRPTFEMEWVVSSILPEAVSQTLMIWCYKRKPAVSKAKFGGYPRFFFGLRIGFHKCATFCGIVTVAVAVAAAVALAGGAALAVSVAIFVYLSMSIYGFMDLFISIVYKHIQDSNVT